MKKTFCNSNTTLKVGSAGLGIILIYSMAVIGCTGKSDGTNPVDPVAPIETGSPGGEAGTTAGGSQESSTFFPIDANDSLAVNEPEKLNLYIEQHAFNPSISEGVFRGIKNKATLDCGKISVGETSPQLKLKVFNDKSAPVTLVRPTFTSADLTIIFDASHVFPLTIHPKSEVDLKFKLSAATEGVKRSELIISSADDASINISLNSK